MKPLAFVIQRYGQDVNGGAEALCRQVAERLAPEIPIEVLTTCARDYLTWADHYPPGREEISGVGVRRFAVARQRRVRAFGRLSKKVYGRSHSFAQEGEWMDRQGPDVPELYRFIAAHRNDYDLFVFFTYLYPPTFFGLPLVAEKSLLVPMAHDEPSPSRPDIQHRRRAPVRARDLPKRLPALDCRGGGDRYPAIPAAHVAGGKLSSLSRPGGCRKGMR
jgi:hypothetical protein